MNVFTLLSNTIVASAARHAANVVEGSRAEQLDEFKQKKDGGAKRG